MSPGYSVSVALNSPPKSFSARSRAISPPSAPSSAASGGLSGASSNRPMIRVSATNLEKSPALM